MTNTSSFERVNYLTRPNKNIERRVTFENLVKLHPLVGFAAYRYLGFGSMWFVDFLFAHRLLGIDDMWSIEFPENAARADFNRPYRSIEVKAGISNDVLKAITHEEWAKPTVVWLDYNGILDANVVSDIKTLCVKLAAGSFLIISVNASRNSYRVPDPASSDGRKIASFLTVSDLLGRTSVAEQFLSVCDARGVLTEVTERDFPEFLSDAILSFIPHTVNVAGRVDGPNAARFIPMFDFSHRDGADMVTVGGVLSAPGMAAEMEEAIRSMSDWDTATARPKHVRLDLIELTVKEKTTLDGLLPTADGPNFVRLSKKAGICLADNQISKYRECYRHFPVFIESFI